MDKCIVGFAAAAIVLVGLLALAVLLVERRSALAAGALRAADYARLLEEQTARAFGAVDLALRSVVHSLERNPGLPEHDPALQREMLNMLQLMPSVRALYFVAPDGFILHDTEHPRTPRLSLADRPYFQAHRDDAGLGLRIGTPLRSRSTGGWFVGVTRRLTLPDGGFGGVAVAAVEPPYDEALYRELGLKEHDAVTLFRTDGTLIFRTPEREGTMGEDLSHLKLFSEELKRKPRGAFRAEGELSGGRPRLIAYREVDGLPLVVAVALDEASLLAPWRRTALAMLALYLAYCAVVWALATAWARRWQERRQIRRKARALQKLHSLSQISGSMAHDFNNVLAAVKGALQTIERCAHDPERVRMLTRPAGEAVEHGARLVAQLRAFARGQALELRDVDLVEQLRRLEPTLRQAAGPSVDLRLRLPAPPLKCRVDQTQFDAALLNLVANARDAMSDGGEIRISADAIANRARREVRLVVEDDGPGIPENVRNRMFEPFFTTKADRGGTGLGLAQVYGFVQQIGGDVRVRSRPGAGSAFELLLPCPPPAAPPAGRVAPQPETHDA